MPCWNPPQSMPLINSTSAKTCSHSKESSETLMTGQNVRGGLYIDSKASWPP